MRAIAGHVALLLLACSRSNLADRAGDPDRGAADADRRAADANAAPGDASPGDAPAAPGDASPPPGDASPPPGDATIVVPPCTADADCEAGEVCRYGVCGPTCVTSATCPRGMVCLAEHCEPCASTAQCTGGLGCRNGACVACTEHADCGPGYRCDNRSCDPLPEQFRDPRSIFNGLGPDDCVYGIHLGADGSTIRVSASRAAYDAEVDPAAATLWTFQLGPDPLALPVPAGWVDSGGFQPERNSAWLEHYARCNSADCDLPQTGPHPTFTAAVDAVVAMEQARSCSAWEAMADTIDDPPSTHCVGVYGDADATSFVLHAPNAFCEGYTYHWNFCVRPMYRCNDDPAQRFYVAQGCAKPADGSRITYRSPGGFITDRDNDPYPPLSGTATRLVVSPGGRPPIVLDTQQVGDDALLVEETIVQPQPNPPITLRTYFKTRTVQTADGQPLTCAAIDTRACPGCNDGAQCTRDICDDRTLACGHAAHFAACDDGNACTVADTCSSGTCTGRLPYEYVVTQGSAYNANFTVGTYSTFHDTLGTTGGATSNDFPTIMATFPAPVRVTAVTVGGGNLPGYGLIATALNGRRIQYSSDAGTWTTAITVSGVTDTGATQFVRFPLGAPITARYWRLETSFSNIAATSTFVFELADAFTCAVTGPCVDDTDCFGAHACDGGSCGQCSTSASCGGSGCVAGVCAPCTDDTQCGASGVCQAGGCTP